MGRDRIEIKGVHAPRGYSHATRIGDTLYVAGQIALDHKGKLVGRGDLEAQVRQVYANLSAVLHEFDFSLDDIFKTTIYLTHPRFVEPFRVLRSEIMGDRMPTSTLLVVRALALPDLMVEIEAIAARP